MKLRLAILTAALLFASAAAAFFVPGITTGSGVVNYLNINHFIVGL